MATATAELLAILEDLSAHTTQMLDVLDSAGEVAPAYRREVKRRILQIRTGTHELIDWLSEIKLEDSPN